MRIPPSIEWGPTTFTCCRLSDKIPLRYHTTSSLYRSNSSPMQPNYPHSQSLRQQLLVRPILLGLASLRDPILGYSGQLLNPVTQTICPTPLLAAASLASPLRACRLLPPLTIRRPRELVALPKATQLPWETIKAARCPHLGHLDQTRNTRGNNPGPCVYQARPKYLGPIQP